MRAGIRRAIRRLRRDQRGALMIELAFAMPLLATLMLGGVEVGRYVLLHQKLDRVASSVADLTSQAQTLSTTDLQNIFDAAHYVAEPFDISTSGTVIISSISNPIGSAETTMNWQESGAGSLTATSHMGTPGGTVNPARRFQSRGRRDDHRRRGVLRLHALAVQRLHRE